ncbi:hypothetical protein [Paenibacillus radicis (ex Xue et al. 2023)]|uniref:Uncharacterized protein n=1 Tax=Paenibacillus radicis (ex Xue et al. 2023) TaxID=2972489 RepID=A0ABT1YKK1_9BACL|nr:hypothetical protein [Paenibacillus radicis (ex Xue et al. 2023)]MCR8633713.1 hypothetical protein [Paenibacillus radicis (ex Xue et al. 2023)]
MNITINIFFSFIEFLAGITFVNALFRIPRYLDPRRIKALSISLISACISGYINTFWQNPLASIFVIILLWIISFAVIYHITIWLSTLIGILSAMVGVGLEFAAYLIGDLLQGLTNHVLSDTERNIYLLGVSAIIFLVAYFLESRKLGLVIPKMFSKPTYNKQFLLLSFLLLTGLLILIITSTMYSTKVGILHIIIALSLVFTSYIVVYLAYRYNRKVLNDKYKRLGDNREHY